MQASLGCAAVFHVKHSRGGTWRAPRETKSDYRVEDCSRSASNACDMIAREVIDHFAAAAEAVGCDLTGAQIERLETAATWLARLGRGSGISGYDTADLALMRGMAPALAYFALDVPRRGLLADVGAGNGAIGATIAILCENLSVCLVDRAQRAYTACEILVARLHLPNLRAVRMDAQDAPAATYDVVVFRALAPGHVALSTTSRLVPRGGSVVAYHRADDHAFLAARTGLTPVMTVPTVLPGLVATAYRA